MCCGKGSPKFIPAPAGVNRVSVKTGAKKSELEAPRAKPPVAATGHSIYIPPKAKFNQD